MSRPEEAATKAFYDATAERYMQSIGTTISEAVEAPGDIALLADFADAVGEGRPVADLGCGPGRATAFLADRGLAAVGLDISEHTVRVARASHPALPFAVAPHDPEVVARGLAAARFVVERVTVRSPLHAHESTDQAFILATTA